MGAVLRSAILPGLGQIYNESYWKAPIIWSATGFFVYGWISYNNFYKDYRNKFSESLNNSTNGNSVYLKYREFYRDQRDLFALYIGLTYLLNLVDAYVDAHLFDFDAQFQPATGTGQLSVRINF